LSMTVKLPINTRTEITKELSFRIYEQFRRDYPEIILDLGTIQYRNTYNIRIRPYYGIALGNWGASCAVSTPMRPVNTSLVQYNCTTPIEQATDIINCIPVSNATNYQWVARDLNTGDTISTYTTGSASTQFQMTQFSGLSMDISYFVQVRAQSNSPEGLIWGNYGNSCTVTIPNSVPLTSLEEMYREQTFASLTESITCTPVDGATGYKWRFVNGEIEYYATVNSPDNSIVLKTTGILHGQTYDVSVCALQGEFMGNYDGTYPITIGDIPTTTLTPETCGQTFYSLDGALECTSVLGADSYNWEIYDNSNTVLVASFSTSNTTVLLSAISGITFGNTYNVHVSVTIGSQTSSANQCSFSLGSIPTTTLLSSLCDKTLAITSSISCEPVTGATSYELTFTNGLNSFVKTINATTNSLLLSSISEINYTKTYSITVRVNMNGNYSSVGSACSITIANAPITQLSSGYRDISLTYMSQGIKCDAASNISGYRFEFVDGLNTYYFSSTSNTIALSSVSGLLYGKTYSVRVNTYRTTMYETIQGSSGNAYNVTIKPLPTTTLIPTSCGVTLSNLTDLIYCYTFVGASYEWEIYNASNSLLIKTFVAHNHPSISACGMTYGVTYNVRIRLRVGTQIGNFGPYCSVTVSGLKSEKVIEAVTDVTENQSDNVIISPIPTKEDITIRNCTQYNTISIFNSIGQKLHQQKINSNEIILDLRLYPNGLYYIILENDTNKVIKPILIE